MLECILEIIFLMLDLGSLIYRIPALLFAITIHEYAHAQCADSLGDPTPRFMGRLSFNPLSHLDPIGALLLVIAGFGWAKPVVINPSNFRNRREDMIRVALAGPGSNLLLCFMAAFLSAVMNKFGLLSDGVHAILFWIQRYNVWFAFFNLIPIPPLDGSKFLLELLPAWTAYKLEYFMGRYGFFILIALVFAGVVSAIVNPFAKGYMVLVNSILGIFFK